MEVGNIYGQLRVVELLPAKRVLVDCSCGVRKEIRRADLPNGEVVSCGHVARERTSERSFKHGMRGTPEYYAWQSAKTRTTNPNDRSWNYYGGRGIRMAEEWLHDFAAFFAHIGPRPGPGYSIDRIDNNGNYEPGNVRWATASEQVANRRTRS